MIHRPANSLLEALPALPLALTMTLGLTGCGDEPRAGETMTRLRIGVLPDESAEVIRQRYQPLLAYLEDTTGIPCELTVPESYESLLSSFRSDEVDLAHFGGFTYVVARELSGAVPLVMRAEDRRFVSCYLVAGQSTAESIEALAGSRLAFGSALSTSGHLMPRHFLQERGITPEQHFRDVRYTGSHDATAIAVRDGDADVGVANALIVDAMWRDGRLAPDDVRILEETPPYVDYVWAARRDMPDALRIAVLDAFLALAPRNDDHRDILLRLDAEAFHPAAPAQFDDIASIVREMGVLEELR